MCVELHYYFVLVIQPGAIITQPNITWVFWRKLYHNGTTLYLYMKNLISWVIIHVRFFRLPQDMYLLTAMGPPGGGRMVISQRLQSRFNLMNMTFPHESQIKRIFGSMINQKLADFEEEIKPIGDIMTQATIEMYQAVVNRFLPTPTKIHYLFNLRDISRVGRIYSTVQCHITCSDLLLFCMWLINERGKTLDVGLTSLMPSYSGRHLKKKNQTCLTHCGLVMSYGNTGIGHHWFK